MPKVKKSFQFNYPLSRKVVCDLKITTEQFGHLTISCTAYCDPSASRIDPYERYSIDIDSIEGSVLDALNCNVMIEAIEDACVRYAADMFEANEREVAA